MLRQILDDAETQRFLPELCEAFQTSKSLQQFITAFDKYLSQEEGILWGMRKDDTLIGFIAIMDIPDSPTLFYAMHPEYRNGGIMKECAAEVVRFFQSYSFPAKLQSEVYEDNAPSIHILKKMGFAIIDQQGPKKVMRQIDCSTFISLNN